MTEYQAIQVILGSAEETDKYRKWVRAHSPLFVSQLPEEIKANPELVSKEATRLAAKAYIQNMR